MKKNVLKNSNFLKPLSTSLLVCFSLFFLACSDDDGDNPEPVEEEETITTMTVTLTETGGNGNITLQSKDLDGDGPNAPEITISGNLSAETAYTGSIALLNETESPAENVTEEIEEEDDAHQFFFTVSGALTETSYSDTDGDGNPIGLSFTLTTGMAGDGSLTVTLRHQPKKPNDGTLTDAGGETDIAQTFNVTVE